MAGTFNNDGDGKPDSVWVDLGMPVRFTSDGRAYKPLFAILCLDLDSRLNINAHGSFAQTQSYTQPPGTSTGQAGYCQQAMMNESPKQPLKMDLQNYSNLYDPPGAAGINIDPGTGYSELAKSAPKLAPILKQNAFLAAPANSKPVSTPSVALPRGQGTGAAEVNLLPLFRDPHRPWNFLWPTPQNPTQANLYQSLLCGSGTLAGRYGPGIGHTPPALPPGVGWGSYLTWNSAFPYNGVFPSGPTNWTNYWSSFQLIFDAFGSPPDPQTMEAVALDRAGRPMHISAGGPVFWGPYDLSLHRNASRALGQNVAYNPFSVAELESVVRPYDSDANTLSQRLIMLTSSGSGSVLPARSAEITTESYGVPCASAVLPPSLRQAYVPTNPSVPINLNDPKTFVRRPLLANYRSTHPVNMLEAKVRLATQNPPNTNTPINGLYGMRLQLLPPELLQGLKMNINRPFGSGAFSMQGANGALIWGGSKSVPDQPGTTGEQVKQYSNPAGPGPAWHNYSHDGGDGDVSVPPCLDSLTARQLYARHLYVLAMALSDSSAIAQSLQNDGQSGTPDDVSRLLAQWAVNVVAYRDHNSIMIPFPYDPNPFSQVGKSGGVGPACRQAQRRARRYREVHRLGLQAA